MKTGNLNEGIASIWLAYGDVCGDIFFIVNWCGVHCGQLHPYADPYPYIRRLNLGHGGM